MKKLNEIYSFTLSKKVKREVTEEGEDNTKVIKTVEEEQPVKIIFKNPSRTEREEADMIYAIEYGKCVRAGVLTNPLLEKLYDEREKSGILVDDFAAKYISLYERFFRLQNEFTQLSLKEGRTDEEERTMNEAAVEFAQIRNELQALETSRNNLFQNTAETKAQNKTILWLTLSLTYFQEGNQDPKVFFKGGTLEEKLAYYDTLIEEGGDFSLKVVDRMSFFVALWFMRKASTKEDFSQIEKDLNLNVNVEPVDVVEPQAVEA